MSQEIHLTKRESQIIELVAEGLDNKEIAFRLNISCNTVRSFLERLRKKLEIKNRVHFALYYLRNIKKVLP